nr:MAG TPA: hypothetical protein [Caudoviricetes sp.]
MSPRKKIKNKRQKGRVEHPARSFLSQMVYML